MTVTYTNFGGMVVKENRDGVKRGYVPDPQGNTVALVDSSGAVTDTWEYWPYGEVESHTGSSPTPFTFCGTLGYYKDPGALTYVRARYYNAQNGQWQTMDPLWPWSRPYVYAKSSPTNFSDPLGLAPDRGKCRLTFFCFRALLVSIRICQLCLQTQSTNGSWESVKCWSAGTGSGELPPDELFGSIPPGRWCFDKRGNWFDMGAISGNPAWGEGKVCMPLRPCDETEKTRLQKCYPDREFHDGSFTIHGGAEANRYRSSGCITIKSSEIEELKRLTKEKCTNPTNMEVIVT